MTSHRLIESAWPAFDNSPDPIDFAPLLRARLSGLAAILDREGFTHAMVYGDREHSANLLALVGFDPRFEEALLIAGKSGKPLLLVGNECEAYLPISPLFRSGEIRSEVYQPFSLQDQPRERSRSLEEILLSEGVGQGAKVALIGWKPYANPRHSDLPAYIVDTARELGAAAANRTLWLTDPANGLRIIAGHAEIALFEANNVKASEAMKRIQFALRPGMSDHELLAQEARYDGTPLSCHMTLKTGPKRVSLASPGGNVIERGHTWSANIAYWGANICRANWVAQDERDLPLAARDYIDEFAGPYFSALADWLRGLRIDAGCGELFDEIHSALPFDKFHVYLNPGHHIHYDEWPGSPFYLGSEIRLKSGMVLQSDVIPSHPVYFSARMEDGFALADAELRGEIQSRYPNAWRRIEARRAFMQRVLRIDLAPEVLALSNMAGIVAPWALSPNTIFASA